MNITDIPKPIVKHPYFLNFASVFQKASDVMFNKKYHRFFVILKDTSPDVVMPETPRSKYEALVIEAGTRNDPELDLKQKLISAFSQHCTPVLIYDCKFGKLLEAELKVIFKDFDTTKLVEIDI